MPTHLKIGPVLLASKLARARLPRHRFGPDRLDIDQTRSLWHRFGFARLNTSPSLNDSKSARACTIRHRPGPTRLDIGLVPHDSTLSQARMSRCRPWPPRLDISLDPLARHQSELARLDIGPGSFGSTWTWVNFAQPAPELSWLNLDRAKSKSNPKYNLDNSKMYPIHI